MADREPRVDGELEAEVLAANRAGRLTDKQKQALHADAMNLWNALTLFVTVTAALVAAWLAKVLVESRTLYAESPFARAGYAVVAASVGVVVYLLFKTRRARAAASIERVAVACEEGELTSVRYQRASYEARGVPLFHAYFGKKRFTCVGDVGRRARELHGKRVRAYYVHLPGYDKIVSLEAAAK